MVYIKDSLNLVAKPIETSYNRRFEKTDNSFSTDYCHQGDKKLYRIYGDSKNGQFFIKEDKERFYFLSQDCQRIRQLLRQNEIKTDQKTKVLIIEGGGAFGIIPAHFLSLVERHSLRWMDDIDCLSGCSIGGILALCYATGLSPVHVLETFQEKMKSCFDKRFAAMINPIACPTYNNEGLDAVLKNLLGEMKLADIKKKFPLLDVFVPALNLTENKYKVFDNISGDDFDVLCRDVGGFTSAAPSYYYGREFKNNCIVDGGMIEVAPLITTVTGLLGKKNIPFNQMDVLMIGCGQRTDSKKLTCHDYNELSLLGIATDVLAPYVTLSNSLATQYWGNHLGLNSFTYFNPVPVDGEMDNIDDMNAALRECPNYDEQFVEAWVKWSWLQ